jgi:hypothetical protein
VPESSEAWEEASHTALPLQRVVCLIPHWGPFLCSLRPVADTLSRPLSTSTRRIPTTFKLGLNICRGSSAAYYRYGIAILSFASNSAASRDAASMISFARRRMESLR